MSPGEASPPLRSTTDLVEVDTFGSIVAVTSVAVLLEVTELVTRRAHRDGVGHRRRRGFGHVDHERERRERSARVERRRDACRSPPAPRRCSSSPCRCRVVSEARGQRVGHRDDVVFALHAGAAFDTVMVYWPVPPDTNVPVWVIVTPRSTAGSDVALTICAISSTRSAPAEYSVVAAVWPGDEIRADVVLVDVDAVAGGDALRVDGAVELLDQRIAAGTLMPSSSRLPLKRSASSKPFMRGRVRRVAFEREHRDAAVDVACRDAEAVRAQRELAAVEQSRGRRRR